jgi:hypothetical protein
MANITGSGRPILQVQAITTSHTGANKFTGCYITAKMTAPSTEGHRIPIATKMTAPSSDYYITAPK